MAAERSDEDRVKDLLDLMDEVAEYVLPGWEAFLSDRMRQRSVERCVEVIGEAAARVGRDLEARHPEVPWRDLTDYRNFAIHEYAKVEVADVWTFARELAARRPALERVYELEWGRGHGREFER